jgi:hypothetical protein
MYDRDYQVGPSYDKLLETDMSHVVPWSTPEGKYKGVKSSGFKLKEKKLLAVDL